MRVGFPLLVRTITAPINTARKANPPATPNTTPIADCIKGAPDLSVYRHPKTVKYVPFFSSPLTSYKHELHSFQFPGLPLILVLSGGHHPHKSQAAPIKVGTGLGVPDTGGTVACCAVTLKSYIPCDFTLTSGAWLGIPASITFF